MNDVYREIDNEKLVNAYELIRGLLDEGCAEAQYVYAMYITHEDESAEDYDRRSLKYIKLAADQLYPEALYRLGVLYLTGEGVPMNKQHASKLFRLAAERGHGLAKVSYAIDLYYGTNEVTIDRDHALNLISGCVDDHIDGAYELLQKWRDEQ